MADKLNPGMGGSKNPALKRLGDAENFLGQFSKTRITARDALGNERQFDVLAATGPSATTAPAATGAFWGMYLKKGDTMLQGGTAGGKTIEDLKVLDGKTNIGTLKGKILWVKLTYNGTLADGVLVPGVTVTAATCSVTSTVGTSIPTNTYPTAKSANGKFIHVEIGRWTDTTFLPARQGHIEINACYQAS